MSSHPHTELRATAEVVTFTPRAACAPSTPSPMSWSTAWPRPPTGSPACSTRSCTPPSTTCAAPLTRLVAELDARHPVKADKPARVGVIYAAGWRQQLPGTWPHYPDEPHHCHTAGHWTRDGRQLVLACCGLDAT